MREKSDLMINCRQYSDDMCENFQPATISNLMF